MNAPTIEATPCPSCGAKGEHFDYCTCHPLESQPVPVEPGFLPVMRKLAAKNLSGSEKLTATSLADNVGRNVSQIAHDELSEALAKLEEA